MLGVRSRLLSLAFVLVALLLSASGGGSAASAAPVANPFGPNVLIFDPSMPVSQIQAAVDAIYAQQVNAEWARTATRCCSSRVSTAAAASRCR
jgi:hypothetical protein